MAWNATVVSNAADDDSVAASQQPGGAGSLTLTASTVSFGSGASQLITITSTANISNRTLTISGTDNYDNTISQALTGPNNATVTSTFYFKTVTGVTISGAAAGNLSVGNAADSISRMYVCDSNINPFSVSMGCIILNASSPTFTVQHTFDNVLATNYSQTSTSNTWFPHSSISGDTTNQDGNYDFPVKAVRLLLTAAGSVRIQLLQSGTQGST